MSTRKVLSVLIVVAIVGLGAYAFAGWGPGYGRGGGCPRWGAGGYGPGYGAQQNLPPEAQTKLYEARSKYMQDTNELRQDLYQKELEMRSELAKETPDKKKLAGIQKDLSKLQAQMDQKRIDYMLEMKKVGPNAGSGYGSGCRGRGRMGGYGKGYGGCPGGGGCW